MAVGTRTRQAWQTTSPPPTTSAADATAEWRPRSSPVLIAISVMLGTFMEVLDTSVANVALPHIAGSLSATPSRRPGCSPAT